MDCKIEHTFEYRGAIILKWQNQPRFRQGTKGRRRKHCQRRKRQKAAQRCRQTGTLRGGFGLGEGVAE